MNPLYSRLAALRQRLRSVSLLRGVSLVAVTIAGGMLLAGYLDWRLHMPAAVRAFLLLSILGSTLVVATRYLFGPLAARSDDLALALRVEREYPVLNDALASTVQFLQQPVGAEHQGSPALRQEAIQRALRLAQGCDFNRVVDTRGVRFSSVLAGLTLALAAAVLLWQPAIVRSAVLRLAHPFGEHEWPTQTQLEIDYPKRVAAGQKFQIRGTVTGVVPKNAVLRLKSFSDGDLLTREYPIAWTQDGKGTFVAKLDLERQNGDFQFVVEANDARKPLRQGQWLTVQVAQPPRLIALNNLPPPQKVELDFPSYTGLPNPRKLPAGTKHIEAVEGTWISIEAAADRPLKSAWLQVQSQGEEQGGKLNAIDAARLGQVGATQPLQLAGWALLAEEAAARIPVQLDDTGTKLAVKFRPWLGSTHVLHIEDDTGLFSEYPFTIQLLSDPPPSIVLEKPDTNRTLMAGADVHLEITAADELFGLRSVFLEFWRKDKKGFVIDHQIKRVALFDPALAMDGKLGGIMDAQGEPIQPPEPGQLLKPVFLKVAKVWSLEGLAKEGETLVIRAGAQDFNSTVVSGSAGYSHEVELTIVGKTEMQISLDKAQSKLLDKMLRLKDLQKAALENIQSVEKTLQEGKAPSGSALKKIQDKVADVDQWQKEIRDLIGQENKDGLLKELELLDQVIKDNKIDSSDANDRVKLLKSELKKIDSKLQTILPQINKIKQQLNDLEEAKAPETKDTKQTLAQTKADQKQVLQSLEDLLQHLDKWAGLQRIRQEAQELLEQQTKVKNQTEPLADDFSSKDMTWKSKLNQLADQQHQLAADAKRLLDKLQRASDEKGKSDPDVAKMLNDALQNAEESRLSGSMKTADEKLRDQQPNYALKNQAESVKTLEEMIAALTENREKQLEKLLKQQASAKEELQDLLDRLEKLQKQVAEAKKIADPNQQMEALKKLADEQQKLHNEAKKKSIELARLRAEEASVDVSKAAKQMAQALQKLDNGDDPTDEQKQAADQLKEAKQKLEMAQQEAEEELAREKLAKIADHIVGLKERQDALIEETERLQKMILQSGWNANSVRPEYLNRLHTPQNDLAKEAASLAQKLKGAKVFDMVLRKASTNMEESAKAMAERLGKTAKRLWDFPFPEEILKDEMQAHAAIVKTQKLAGQRLQSLIDAVKEAQQKAKADEGNKQEPDQQPNQKPKGGLQAQDGIPAIAQLKALKSEQLNVNERTAAFAQAYPNLDKLPPQAQAELKAIHADQQELYDLFEKITAAASKGDDK